ncbi:hypothetical protein FE773_01040 [Caminibacter mediatlanticus TB-2]|uniref:LapA family protein n=1 Tax=Caminibacter mediatlanticus TB-2 TaxID=391592 RepID=A0ABX5V6B2_9BACT|nr:hypothetical protein [Caminibacter mediatlanticus]QCT93812.1 hypothetical protein FE773_01040 [Caminibacter mediatlanticus TB-2]
MKKYFIISLIFIGLVALLVYTQDNSFTTFNIFGINLSLPNAVWIALFLGLFCIFSIIYFFVANLKNTFYQKNVNKDIKTIIENIKNKILYINNTKKTKILNEINNFATNNIEGLNILPKESKNFEFFADIQKLKNGEVIEIGKYKLDENNPWFILNIKNRLKKEPNYAKEVLKKFKNKELKKEAFYIFAKTANIRDILKYDYDINLDILLSHINDKDLGLLINKAKLTPKEEIEFARKLYMTRTPDEELNLVDKMPYAKSYLALKYEHLDLAKDIIEANDIKFFEFFLKLRLAGIKADIDEYIDSKI